MKKFCTQSVLLISICCVIFSHQKLLAQKWVWGRASNIGMEAIAVATDGAGNVYGAGWNEYTSAISFGSVTVPYSIDTSGLPGWAYQPVWVKYDSSGKVLWADGVQNSRSLLNGIATDPAGNLIVFGVFYSASMTIDAITLHNANYLSKGGQYFLAKYNPSGTLLWAICDGDPSSPGTYIPPVNDLSVGVVTSDAAGDIYISSCFTKASMTIGAYALLNADITGYTNDIFVAKYNSSGILQWAVRAGGTADEFAQGITVTQDRNIYIAGTFWSPSITFGSSVITNPYGAGGITTGMPHAYIAEFSSSGTSLWAEGAGGKKGAYAQGVISDQSNNVYLSGSSFDTTISYGGKTIRRTYPATVPSAALYLVKYSPAHLVSWGKTIGSSTFTTSGASNYGIALAPCGDVWVTGIYKDTVNIDGNMLAAPVSLDPVFLAGYDSSGRVVGYSGLVTGGDDQDAIACDLMGNVYLCGDAEIEPFIIGPDTLSSIILTGEPFFMAKYTPSVTCCPDSMYAAFTSSGTSTVNFTYTGTMPYDSIRWDFGDGTTSNVFNPSHTYAMGGPHHVCATVFFICNPMQPYIYCQNTPLTVVNTFINSNVELYPNPVQRELSITSTGTITSITIHNLIGQTVYTQACNADRVQVDVTDLPAGMYLVKINGTEVRKFVKQ